MELFRKYNFDNCVSYTYIATPKEMKKESYKIMDDYSALPMVEYHENCVDLGNWKYKDYYKWNAGTNTIELTIYLDILGNIASMVLYDFVTCEMFTYVTGE